MLRSYGFYLADQGYNLRLIQGYLGPDGLRVQTLLHLFGRSGIRAFGHSGIRAKITMM